MKWATKTSKWSDSQCKISIIKLVFCDIKLQLILCLKSNLNVTGFIFILDNFLW